VFPLSDEIRNWKKRASISKAYFHLSDDGKSQNYLQQAIEMDKEKNFTSEINEVRSLITQDGHLRRLVRYSDGTYQFISVEEAESLGTGADSDSDGEAILDLSHFRPSFSGPLDVVPFERKEAEILNGFRYLSQNSKM
jgi:hypothetical protein